MRIINKIICFGIAVNVMLCSFAFNGVTFNTLEENVAYAQSSQAVVREVDADTYFTETVHLHRDFTPGVIRPDEGAVELTFQINKPMSEFGNNWDFIFRILPAKSIGKNFIVLFVPPLPDRGLWLLFRSGTEAVYLTFPDFDYTAGQPFNIAITWKAGEKLSLYKDGVLLGSTGLKEAINTEFASYSFSLPKKEPYNIQKVKISTKYLTAEELTANPKAEFVATADTALIASNNLATTKKNKTTWHQTVGYSSLMPVWRAETQCFIEDEEIFFPVVSVNHSDAPKNYNVKISATDAYGKSIVTKDAAITVPKGSKYHVNEIMLPELATRGYYKLNTVISLDGKQVSDYESFISVLPLHDQSVQDGALSKSYGQHYHHDYNPSFFRKQNASITRGFDVFKWREVEPLKGKFVWDIADDYVNRCLENDVEILGILGYPSRWATTAPTEEEIASARSISPLPERWKPTDINEWANYVNKVVSRYKGKVKYWEVYNEANFHPPYLGAAFAGSTEDYIELLQVAYREAKKADPDCEVLVTGFAVPHAGVVDNEMPLLLTQEKYAKGYYDIYNVHGYLGPEAFNECITNLEKTRPGTKYWMTEEMPFQIEDLEKRLYYTVNTYISFMEYGYEKFFHMGTPTMDVFNDTSIQSPSAGFQAAGVVQSHIRKCDSFVEKLAGFKNNGSFTLRHSFKRTDGKYLSILGCYPLKYNVHFNGTPEIVEDIYGNRVKVETSGGVSNVELKNILYIVTDEPLKIVDVTDSASSDIKYIKNGGFEDNTGDIAVGVDGLKPTDWVFSDTAGTDGKVNVIDKPATGKYAINIKSTGAKAYISQDVSFTKAGNYKVTAKMQKVTGDSSLVPYISVLNTDKGKEDIIELTNIKSDSYGEVSAVFELTGETTKASVALGILSGNGEILIDDVSIEEYSKSIFAAKNHGEINIDGNITDAEWNDAQVVKIDAEDAIVDIKDWRGVKDISANVYVKWDDKNLYIAAKVEDDNHYQADKGVGIWEGDSFQFAFYDGNVKEDQPGKNTEMAVALSGEDVIKWRHIAPIGKKTGKLDNIECGIKRDGTSTNYEISVPWEEILASDTKVGENEKYGLSLLINDNDGAGRRGWMEYGSGIGGDKIQTLYCDLILGGAGDFASNVNVKLYIGNNKATINGKEVDLDAPPLLYNSRTMVPVRFIGEALGAQLQWEESTGTVTITRGDTKIILIIGNNTAVINNVDVELDAEAILNNSRTMVPIRFIGEAFGANVGWDEATREVSVTVE